MKGFVFIFTLNEKKSPIENRNRESARGAGDLACSAVAADLCRWVPIMNAVH